MSTGLSFANFIEILRCALVNELANKEKDYQRGMRGCIAIRAWAFESHSVRGP